MNIIPISCNTNQNKNSKAFGMNISKDVKDFIETCLDKIDNKAADDIATLVTKNDNLTMTSFELHDYNSFEEGNEFIIIRFAKEGYKAVIGKAFDVGSKKMHKFLTKVINNPLVLDGDFKKAERKIVADEKKAATINDAFINSRN